MTDPRLLFSSFAMKVAKRIIPLYRVSYSQRAEDIIVQDIFKMLDIKKPRYLDIGTNDPIKGNNTYLLYTNGSRGICVEPSPKLAQRIIAKRPGDVCLNVGVTDGNDTAAKFYVFENDSLSTFSPEQAKFLKEQTKYKLIDEVLVNVLSVKSILEKYFSESRLNFMSLDCEGVDFTILQSMDFKSVCPEVVCVETIECSKEGCGEKRLDIIKLMIERDYVVFADTYINTIFIHKDSAKAINAMPKLYMV